MTPSDCNVMVTMFLSSSLKIFAMTLYSPLMNDLYMLLTSTTAEAFKSPVYGHLCMIAASSLLDATISSIAFWVNASLTVPLRNPQPSSLYVKIFTKSLVNCLFSTTNFSYFLNIINYLKNTDKVSKNLTWNSYIGLTNVAERAIPMTFLYSLCGAKRHDTFLSIVIPDVVQLNDLLLKKNFD